MKKIKGEMLGVSVEFQIFGNRIYLKSNNPMVEANFIKFLDDTYKKSPEAATAIVVDKNNKSEWICMENKAEKDDAEAERKVFKTLVDGLTKAGMKVTTE